MNKDFFKKLNYILEKNHSYLYEKREFERFEMLYLQVSRLSSNSTVYKKFIFKVWQEF